MDFSNIVVVQNLPIRENGEKLVQLISDLQSLFSRSIRAIQYLSNYKVDDQIISVLPFNSDAQHLGVKYVEWLLAEVLRAKYSSAEMLKVAEARARLAEQDLKTAQQGIALGDKARARAGEALEKALSKLAAVEEAREEESKKRSEEAYRFDWTLEEANERIALAEKARLEAEKTCEEVASRIAAAESAREGEHKRRLEAESETVILARKLEEANERVSAADKARFEAECRTHIAESAVSTTIQSSIDRCVQMLGQLQQAATKVEELTLALDGAKKKPSQVEMKATQNGCRNTALDPLSEHARDVDDENLAWIQNEIEKAKSRTFIRAQNLSKMELQETVKHPKEKGIQLQRELDECREEKETEKLGRAHDLQMLIDADRADADIPIEAHVQVQHDAYDRGDEVIRLERMSASGEQGGMHAERELATTDTTRQKIMHAMAAGAVHEDVLAQELGLHSDVVMNHLGAMRIEGYATMDADCWVLTPKGRTIWRNSMLRTLFRTLAARLATPEPNQLENRIENRSSPEGNAQIDDKNSENIQSMNPAAHARMPVFRTPRAPVTTPEPSQPKDMIETSRNAQESTVNNDGDKGTSQWIKNPAAHARKSLFFTMLSPMLTSEYLQAPSSTIGKREHEEEGDGVVKKAASVQIAEQDTEGQGN